MRVLLTNDDGINAAGFGILQQIAAELADEVWSVAPESDQSGTAHSLTLLEPLRCKAIGERSFAVRGTPTDCVILAVKHLMPQKPDLILSGVNHGENAAINVTYSGTVAGAIEGTLLGIRSIALSLSFGGRGISGAHWDTPARHGPPLIRRLIGAGWPSSVLINVNFPDRPPDGALEPVITRQALDGDSVWRIVDRMDDRGKPYFWLGYDTRKTDAGEGTDLWAVRKGHISVTPLHFDMTHDGSLAHLATAILQNGDSPR
jgi:5'-nucleotidase